MMDRTAFDAVCKALPATFMVVQWGDSHVWKVGEAGGKNKVFAASTFWVGKDENSDHSGGHALVFKVTPMSFEMLTQEPGIMQAPYFPRGGWIRVNEDSPLNNDDLAAYIGQAHRMMASSLTKKLQAQLGLSEYLAAG